MRRRICRALNMLRNKTVENPWKKHDNIPLQGTCGAAASSKSRGRAVETGEGLDVSPRRCQHVPARARYRVDIALCGPVIAELAIGSGSVVAGNMRAVLARVSVNVNSCMVCACAGPR